MLKHMKYFAFWAVRETCVQARILLAKCEWFITAWLWSVVHPFYSLDTADYPPQLWDSLFSRPPGHQTFWLFVLSLPCWFLLSSPACKPRMVPERRLIPSASPTVYSPPWSLPSQILMGVTPQCIFPDFSPELQNCRYSCLLGTWRLIGISGFDLKPAPVSSLPPPPAAPPHPAVLPLSLHGASSAVPIAQGKKLEGKADCFSLSCPTSRPSGKPASGSFKICSNSDHFWPLPPPRATPPSALTGRITAAFWPHLHLPTWPSCSLLSTAARVGLWKCVPLMLKDLHWLPILLRVKSKVRLVPLTFCLAASRSSFSVSWLVNLNIICQLPCRGSWGFCLPPPWFPFLSYFPSSKYNTVFI